MGKNGKAGASEVAVTVGTVDLIRHAPLRVQALAALGRGQAVRLLRGGGEVETLVSSDGRAAQCAGAHLSLGMFSGERLFTDSGGHALDLDGTCFCRDCEMAGGHCVDDDE